MTRRRPLMALLSGSAAALVMLSVPVPLLEMVVASTGLSEVVPSAAPPLGLNARAMLAGFAGMLGIGLSLALQARSATEISGTELSEDEEDAGEPAKGEGKMGFALSKLTSFTRSRGRKAPVLGLEAIEPMPVLRRADSHPDAPARRPIFASRDFDGTEPFTRPLIALEPEAFIEPEPSEPVALAEYEDSGLDLLPLPAEEIEGFAMPRSPEPMDDQALLAEAIVAHDIAAVRVSLDGLSITELVDRFEQGIARRKVLAQAAAASQRMESVLAETDHALAASADPMPVLADIPPVPPVAVRSDVDKDVELALRAALNSLHQMTGR